MSSASEIHAGAVTLFDRLPEPRLEPSSKKLYLETLGRMMAEKIVDPLRSGDARDTYNVRRAALHAGTWILLKRHIDAFRLASETGDRTAAGRAIRVLAHIVARCEAAIDRDPPMNREQSSFASPPSRWSLAEGPKPRRAKTSKKHALKMLPANWAILIWEKAQVENWKYLDALAVHILSPVRPAEFVAGQRDGREVAGVELRLKGDVLVIGVTPVKSHGGKYGTGETAIQIDAKSDVPAVAHLVALCGRGQGRAIVSLGSTNPMRKALAKLGKKVLGDCVVVTGYLFRHQYLADLKATVGAGSEVAAAAGHCTDRTQARYGRVEHGRRRSEFISATGKRPPKATSVVKVLAIARSRAGPDPASRG
jgi:hypothetical protein